jgi:hypothetical protein
MSISLLLALCFPKLLDLPLQPVNLWEDARAIPLKVQALSDTRYRITAGNRQWDLYLRQSERQSKIILRPPDKVTLSFRIPEKVQSVRLTPHGEAPILQFAAPGSISFSCDGFYFPSKNIAWQFSGPEFTLYEGDTGAIKVSFTKNSDTLIINVLDVSPAPSPNLKGSAGARDFWGRLREYLLSLMEGGAGQSLPPPLPTSQDETEWRAYLALRVLLGKPVLPLPEGSQAQPPFWASRFRQSMEVRSLDLFRISQIPSALITHTSLAQQPAALLCLINPTPHPRSFRINLAELGLNSDYPWTLFDLMNFRYLSAVTGALAVTLSPYESRLYLMRRFMARPQVIGSDDDVWDLIRCGLQEEWDPKKGTLRVSLSSSLQNNEASLFLATAFDEGIWKPREAFRNSEKWPLYPNLGFWRIPLSVSTPSPPAPLPLQTSPRLSDLAPAPQDPQTSPPSPILVQFVREKAELLSAPELGIGPGSPWAVSLTRPTMPNDPYAGFYVFRNTTLIGYFTDPAFLDDEVDPECDYSYTVFGVGYGGDPSLPKTFYIHTPAPTDMPLVHLFPYAWSPALYVPLKNASPTGSPLTLKGDTVSGWCVPVGGTLSFRLSRAFETFSGTVSPLEGWAGDQPLVFEIYGDDELLFRSKPLSRGEMETFEVEAREVYTLKLRVTGNSPGAFGLWANPFLKAKRPPPDETHHPGSAYNP